jgi:hypothetical protein
MGTLRISMGYERNKMINVKSKDKEIVFEVTGEARVNGKING